MPEELGALIQIIYWQHVFGVVMFVIIIGMIIVKAIQIWKEDHDRKNRNKRK